MKTPCRALEEFGRAFDVGLDVNDELVEWFNRDGSKVDSRQGEPREKGNTSDDSACHDATEQHG